MSEFLHNFHFLRPIVLSLLPLLMIFIYFMRKSQSGISSWEEVCDKNLLSYLLVTGAGKNRRNIQRLILSCLIVATIAGAGPTWKQKELPAVYEQNPLFIVLNVSSDTDTGESSSPLLKAKYIISDILKTVPDAQSGLMVYSNEPFVVSPLSEDYHIIENILPAIGLDIMPTNGNRIDRAINLAVKKMKDAEFASGNILLITVDNGTNPSQDLKEAMETKKQGYNVSVLQISSTENEILQNLAAQGGGVYFNLRSNLGDFIRLVRQNTGKDIKESENKTMQWEDFGYYLMFLALLCTASLFRREIFVIALILLSAQEANAGFFLNSNQEGLREFEKQNYDGASQKFTDINWQASSLYKAGKFTEALEKFSADNSENGLYNQGNALAKSGKIDEAIKKYEEVLKINPKNEDAAFNLEYLKQQQQQEQQQNSSGDNKNKENQDNKESSSSSSSTENQQNNDDDNQSQGENQQENQSKDKQEDQSSSEQNEGEKQEQNTAKAQAQSENNQTNNEKENNNTNSDSYENQGENTDNKPERQENSQFSPQNPEKTPDKNENNQYSALQDLQNQDEQTTSEEAMARAQQYRLIDSDPGGLLREFIRAEYEKNRYKE